MRRRRRRRGGGNAPVPPAVAVCRLSARPNVLSVRRSRRRRGAEVLHVTIAWDRARGGDFSTIPELIDTTDNPVVPTTPTPTAALGVRAGNAPRSPRAVRRAALVLASTLALPTVDWLLGVRRPLTPRAAAAAAPCPQRAGGWDGSTSPRDHDAARAVALPPPTCSNRRRHRSGPPTRQAAAQVSSRRTTGTTRRRLRDPARRRPELTASLTASLARGCAVVIGHRGLRPRIGAHQHIVARSRERRSPTFPTAARTSLEPR